MQNVSTIVRTRHGEWRLHCYPADQQEAPTVVLVRGDVTAKSGVLVRIQSECFTGHVFGTLSCDCRPQLDEALDELAAVAEGVLIYLRQEGRGIGLLAKVESYNLQADGRDTVDANLELGFGVDDRSYADAAAILIDLGVSSVRLLTNNPAKSKSLAENGMPVLEELDLPTFARPENARYLATKRTRMGHRLDTHG